VLCAPVLCAPVRSYDYEKYEGPVFMRVSALVGKGRTSHIVLQDNNNHNM